jgi:N-dimethylarginine dimethylaminohydrolase
MVTMPTTIAIAPPDDGVVRRRRYLMCPPRHFDVVYRINTWMHPGSPVDGGLALRQWELLRSTLQCLGHQVEAVEPGTGLPDMVFAANSAVVIGDRALAARMAMPERRGEEPLYQSWLAANGVTDIRIARHRNEGEGDVVLVGGRALAGTGFRTEVAAHRELAETFGIRVETLHLADPRWYHLDMALFALDERTVAYYPGAFRPASRRRLERLFPDAIVATTEDALAFGLNAISDGRHIVLPAGAPRLAAELRERGYETIPVDMSELHLAGGSAKCCVLELHPARATT